jgi:hypothetical protein
MTVEQSEDSRTALDRLGELTGTEERFVLAAIRSVEQERLRGDADLD